MQNKSGAFREMMQFLKALFREMDTALFIPLHV